MEKLELNYDKLIEDYDYIVSSIGNDRFTIERFINHLIDKSTSEFLFEVDTDENRMKMIKSFKRVFYKYFDADIDINIIAINYTQFYFNFKNNNIKFGDIIDLKKIKRSKKLRSY